MIKIIESPGKEFNTQKEAFAYLKANKARIINMKKAQIFNSVDKGQAPISKHVLPRIIHKGEAAKALNFVKDGFFYPVINTTLWFDSHKDVHLNGIWNRSIDQNEGKIYYLDSHSMKGADVIAWPEDVNIMLQIIDWKDLGYDIEGKTQALIYEIDKSVIVHPVAKDVIDNKRNVENSVRMQYVKLDLAVNEPEDENYKEEFALWNKIYPEIANKGAVDESGYFWAIEEAKIFKEGSMVLAGSNSATPIVYEKTSTDTVTEDPGPADGTPEKPKSFFEGLL